MTEQQHHLNSEQAINVFIIGQVVRMHYNKLGTLANVIIDLV